MKKHIHYYAQQVGCMDRIVLLDFDSEDFLKELWAYEPLLEPRSGFHPIEIVCSDQPFKDLAEVIFDFCKKDYCFTDPMENHHKCNFPELVKDYIDVDEFIQKCTTNTEILINVISQITGKMPDTLLMGVHLPSSFFEKSVDHLFFDFLRKLPACDYRLCISGLVKPHKYLAPPITSTSIPVEFMDYMNDMVERGLLRIVNPSDTENGTLAKDKNFFLDS